MNHVSTSAVVVLVVVVVVVVVGFLCYSLCKQNSGDQASAQPGNKR